MRMLAVVLLLAGASLSPGSQSSRVERFDTSGLPERATNFLEQQIFEMIGSHRPGDLTGATAIQRKLGRYYTEKGDQVRAAAALRLADEAEAPPQTRAPERKSQGNAPASHPAPPRDPAGSRFSGNYFGYEGRTLHTRDFHDDGTFLHTWIVSGAGTSVRNSERGWFRIHGETLEIALTSSASGFVTPGVGGRTTQAGGNAQTASQTRRLKVQMDQSGILFVLDGIPMKPKSW